MKKTVAAVILTALLSACSQHPGAEHRPHWGYQGEESPAHWGELAEEFATCNTGHLQSPVSLSSKSKSVKTHLDYHYNSARYEIENNGHTVELVPQIQSVNLTLDGQAYSLRQFHVHTPSEHTLDQRQFPLELHFVHTSDNGNIVVIAVMVEAGRENSILAQILVQPVKAGEEKLLSQPLNPRQLFPQNTSHLRLQGSLTTPPCTEGVTWIVMKNPIQASAAQLNAMEKMIGIKNNRPLQTLGDRIIVSEE